MADPTPGTNLGQVGYEAYAEYTGGKTFDGRDMPAWSDLGDRIQRAWMVAGENIQRAIIDHGGLRDHRDDVDDCQLCRIIAAQ